MCERHKIWEDFDRVSWKNNLFQNRHGVGGITIQIAYTGYKLMHGNSFPFQTMVTFVLSKQYHIHGK